MNGKGCAIEPSQVASACTAPVPKPGRLGQNFAIFDVYSSPMTYPKPDPIWNEDPKAVLAEIEMRIAQTGVFYAGSGHFKALAALPANVAQITSTQIILLATEIFDISALSEVPRITHLTLGKRISDISVVRNLCDLEAFDAFIAPLTDISPLASCPRLRSIVSLDVANISDLTYLDGMELEHF